MKVHPVVRSQNEVEEYCRNDIAVAKALFEARPEMVNHPNHYQTSAGIETIDVMEAFTEKLSGVEAVNTSQVLKYICRWKEKNGLEDLKKAQWYLQRLIKFEEEKEIE